MTEWSSSRRIDWVRLVLQQEGEAGPHEILGIRGAGGEPGKIRLRHTHPVPHGGAGVATARRGSLAEGGRTSLSPSAR